MLKIALIGNPNSGKTTIFNHLTGLRQKVANFPGVTVEKKSANIKLANGNEVQIIDFPGTYSMYPTSSDEKVVVQTFCDASDENYPDLIIYIADITQLHRHFLLFTQIIDLGLPVILVLNMMDVAEKEGIKCELEAIKLNFNVEIIESSGRELRNVEQIKKSIEQFSNNNSSNLHNKPFYNYSISEAKLIDRMRDIGYNNPYQSILIAHHAHWLPFLTPDKKEKIANIVQETGFNDLRLQVSETMYRYDKFLPIVKKSILNKNSDKLTRSDKVDNFVTHPFWGILLFVSIMFFMFQAVFSWASFPMDFIEGTSNDIINWLKTSLPSSWFTSLLVEGLLPGLSGIIVFIPQIAILFFFLAILEELGYMSRAVFLFDGIMQKFGLNGRSIISLVSAGACAIPAILSTRTITNQKERLLTILVTPLISCSARIPVYAMLVAFVIEPKRVFGGLFQAQGLVFAALFLLGIISSLLMSIIFSKIIKSEESSSMILELPTYKYPSVKNVLLTVYEKVKSFIKGAGKIIIFISIILWILSSYGPTESMDKAVIEAKEISIAKNLNQIESNDLLASKKLEASYAGHLGKFIEPAIKPLGFNWKIGIALITSFAAREVFVGTMATIYSLGSSSEDTNSLKEKMLLDKDNTTGKPLFSFASAVSLLLFYVFALQCMSTLAVVKKETNGWKWPIVQFVFMGFLAYMSSFIVYNILQ